MSAALRQTNPANVPGSNMLRGIILVCVLVEAVLLLGDLGLFGSGDLRGWAYQYAAFWAGLLHGWQPNYPLQPVLMFITYGFLHGGLLHLVFNMIALWSLGGVVLARIGPRGFAFVYAASLIGGGAAFGLLAQSPLPMVGASGALFGLAGAITCWLWRAQPDFAASLRTTGRIFAFLIAFNVVMYFALSGGLAWQTHLGGFIAGWLVARWYG